jgi:hypothetical protein
VASFLLHWENNEIIVSEQENLLAFGLMVYMPKSMYFEVAYF